MKNTLFFALTLVIITLTGCATHKQTSARTISSTTTRVLGDPQKRTISDKGPLFRPHRYDLKSVQYETEVMAAQIESEAYLRDFARTNGIAYYPRVFGEPPPPAQISNGRRSSVRTGPTYSRRGSGYSVRSPNYR